MTRRPSPMFMRTVDGLDVFAVRAEGTLVALMVPVLEDRMPPLLKEAIVRYRATVLEGECPCGTQLDLDEVVADITAGRRYGTSAAVARLNVEHESGCPAPDAQRLLASWEATRRGEE